MQIENEGATTSVLWYVKQIFHSDSLCRGFILRTRAGIKADCLWGLIVLYSAAEKNHREAPGRHKQLSNTALKLLFRSFTPSMVLYNFYPRTSPLYLLFPVSIKTRLLTLPTAEKQTNYKFIMHYVCH